MPDYLFEDTKTRKVVEIFMSADKCVPIGKIIRRMVRRKVRRLRRLASIGAIAEEPDWRHIGYQFDDEDSKVARDMGLKLDPDTQCPILPTKKLINEFGARIADRDAARNAPSRFRYDYGQFRK